MARGEPMRCPNDGARLVEVDRSDVLIDACPQCRGVWLDRGELDKILVMERRLHAGTGADDDFLREVEGKRPAQEQRPREDDRRYDDDPRYQKKRKRRSLLEELLDFD
jgi:Zn-finger nucleic acid-binding protein